MVMNTEQNSPAPKDLDNVHFIQDTPLYRLRINEELQKLNQEVKDRQDLQDQQARDALREHRLGRIQQLGLYAVRSEKE